MVDPPPPPPDEPLPEAPPPRCPNCGAPHEPFQEYCLECGSRLPVDEAYGSRREVWTREASPAWLWAALLALLAVALVAGAIVAVAATRDSEEEAAPAVPVGTATTETLITGTGTLTVAPPTITVEPPTGTTPTVATPPPPPAGTVVSWPSGQDGYTVILASTPTGSGRGPAEQVARRAIAAGLQEVGVLDSSDYSSLRPGYHVAFSGIYDTLAQAQSALAGARASGFPLAYVREIAA
jgi:hypothetical protein